MADHRHPAQKLPTWWRGYPIILSIYPVLHLAAANAQEWNGLGDLVLPLSVSTVVASLTWLWGWVSTRDLDKGAFLGTLGVIGFSTYGSLLTHVRNASWTERVNPSYAGIVALIAIGTWATLAIARSRHSWVPATRFLSLASVLLVVFALVELAMWQLKPSEKHAPSLPHTIISPRSTLPNIYLIVLDKYTGTASLRSYYNYDNTSIERELRRRGFAVPRKPRANYTFTRQAMASLLNWEYLDDLVAEVGPGSTNLSPLFARIEDNRTMVLLKRLGYEIVFFPNYYPPFRKSRHADIQLPQPHTLRSEFGAIWREATLVGPLVKAACTILHCREDPWLPEPATLHDWKFTQLASLAESPRPRFVLAHFLIPHEPYVYREDCSHIPFADVGPDSTAMRAPYLAQITCLNRKILEIVDKIRETSNPPPVILIQSDHGDGHLPKVRMELEETPAGMVRARFDVFAAYYVPGAPDSLFYDGITPVNLLPRVFNFLFGTTFPQHPDRSLWVVDGAPYRLTDINPDSLR